MMELVVDGDVVSQQPDSALIATTIQGLAQGSGEFAILAIDDSSYVQTASGAAPGAGFVLECQIGSLDQHYNCLDPNLSADAVIQIFTRYLGGDLTWMSEHVWERMNL